ncbi:MAG: RNA polymerase sigma factor [Pirellulaceae bacterium]
MRAAGEAKASGMNEQQEREIAEGLRQGKPDAWRALYDAYAFSVWNAVAGRLGPCRTDVADVVQETFLAAARSARSFDADQGTLWSWLCGITRHHVAQYFRQQRRHARALAVAEGPRPERVLAWLENRETAPLDALVTTETAWLVRATLAGLSDDYEDLLTQKYLRGVSVEQLAGQRSASETAVRSRLARARKAFRQAFTARMTSHSSAPCRTEENDD